MWVRLNTVKNVSINGKLTTYFAGEWIDVGGHLAKSWLTLGDAERPDLPELSKMPDCGILVQGDERRVRSIFPGLAITVDGQDPLPYARTLAWDTRANLRPELTAAGFDQLKTWQVAIPLWSYDKLARDVGDDDDRARTVKIIRDLRVPLYRTDVMFLRRCEPVEELLKVWQVEREGPGDDRLALLRALYQVKPLVLALPTTWIDGTRG